MVKLCTAELFLLDVGPLHFGTGPVDGDGVDNSSGFGIGRYQTEVKRLLGVLEVRLQEQNNLIKKGYTIADTEMWPWVGAFDWGYKASERLQFDKNLLLL